MTHKFWIFDLDDTLVPSSAAYASALEALGPAYDPELYATARRDVKAALGPSPAARNRWLYFKRMLELRDSFSPEALVEMATRYENALHAHLAASWRTLRRADFFARIRSFARVGVLTNENTRAQMLKLRAIDPDAATFGTVVTSEEVGFEKPAPEIFDAIDARLGHPAPTEVVMIGDDVDKDIRPALARGWSAVLTTEFVGSATPVPPGVPCVARLGDLFEVLGAS